MCLSTITTRADKRDAGVRWAWKYFSRGHRDSLEFAHKYLRSSYDVPRGRWLRAEERALYLKPVYPNESEAYQSGFHACRTRKDALQLLSAMGRETSDHEVVRVKVRGVHTIGTQSGVEVLVAAEMLVPARKRKASK